MNKDNYFNELNVSFQAGTFVIYEIYENEITLVKKK